MCISAPTGVFNIANGDFFPHRGRKYSGWEADLESVTSHTPGTSFSLMKFNEGQIVFIIENEMRVSEACVLRSAASFVTIYFENGGGTKLRENRIYTTRREAKEALKNSSHTEVKRGMDWLG